MCIRDRLWPPCSRVLVNYHVNTKDIVTSQPYAGLYYGLGIGGKVKVGDAVKAGQEVAVLEAMKMENAITSDFAGTVKQILVRQGQTVATDAVLMEIE